MKITKIWCKACKQLEDYGKPINYINAGRVVIDGVAYPALYAHPTKNPEDYGGIPAVRMWMLGR